MIGLTKQHSKSYFSVPPFSKFPGQPLLYKRTTFLLTMKWMNGLKTFWSKLKWKTNAYTVWFQLQRKYLQSHSFECHQKLLHRWFVWEAKMKIHTDLRRYHTAAICWWQYRAHERWMPKITYLDDETKTVLVWTARLLLLLLYAERSVAIELRSFIVMMIIFTPQY